MGLSLAAIKRKENTKREHEQKFGYSGWEWGGCCHPRAVGMLGDVPIQPLPCCPFSMAKSFSQPKIPWGNQLFAQLFLPNPLLKVYSCAEV